MKSLLNPSRSCLPAGPNAVPQDLRFHYISTLLPDTKICSDYLLLQTALEFNGVRQQ